MGFDGVNVLQRRSRQRDQIQGYRITTSPTMLSPLSTSRSNALWTELAAASRIFVSRRSKTGLAGSVHRAFDLLVESGLSIVGEVVIPIPLNLIALPGATLEHINAVRIPSGSARAVREVLPRLSAAEKNRGEDTAGSVRKVVQAGDPRRQQLAATGLLKSMGKYPAGAPRRRLRELHAFPAALTLRERNSACQQALSSFSAPSYSWVASSRARSFCTQKNQLDED